MLPEVEEFLSVKTKADKEWAEWNAHSRDDAPRRPTRPGWMAPDTEHGKYELSYREYEAQYREWNKLFHERYNVEQEKHGQIMREARRKLRETTKDPMIVWMMDTIRDYWGYIEAVLPLIPATREQLEDLANRQDWCTEFDAFMDQAETAGIIPPANPKFDATDLIEWVAERTDEYPRRVRREIEDMVNAIVEKALAKQRSELVKGEMQVA
jgi:hypothetical protein